MNFSFDLNHGGLRYNKITHVELVSYISWKEQKHRHYGVSPPQSYWSFRIDFCRTYSHIYCVKSERLLIRSVGPFFVSLQNAINMDGQYKTNRIHYNIIVAARSNRVWVKVTRKENS